MSDSLCKWQSACHQVRLVVLVTLILVYLPAISTVSVVYSGQAGLLNILLAAMVWWRHHSVSQYLPRPRYHGERGFRDCRAGIQHTVLTAHQVVPAVSLLLPSGGSWSWPLYWGGRGAWRGPVQGGVLTRLQGGGVQRTGVQGAGGGAVHWSVLRDTIRRADVLCATPAGMYC